MELKRLKSKKVIACVVVVIISCLSSYLIVKRGTPSTTRYDYVKNCYLLTPKNKKKAYFYNGANSISKEKQVSDIVIPANVAVSTSVRSNGTLLTPNTHKDDPFLSTGISNNINFENNITLNPDYLYPLNEHLRFIKVMPVKYLYAYKGTAASLTTNQRYVVPVKQRVFDSSGDTLPEQTLCYIDLTEYNIKYKSKYNISSSKSQICIGFVNR